MSKIHIYYAPVYFAEKDPNNTRATLLVRKYQKYKTKSGKFATKWCIDVIEYPTPKTMADDIEKQGMKELTQWDDHTFVPPEMRSSSLRKVAKL